MKDRLELNGGTITGGTGYEIGQTVYILSVFTDGAELTFQDYPSYGAALLDAQLAQLDWGLSLHDHIGGR